MMKTLSHPLKLVSAVILLGISSQAWAVNEKGDWPWNLKLHGWHDRAVAEDLGTGWFLNVGPTGLRAPITHEHPQYLTIKYVFKNSPANGLLKIDDIVVGANGKRLTVAHTFGRSGVGALAHSIGNGGNQSWNHLSALMATGCAKSSAGLLDGHASTHMHVLWGSLGAGLAGAKHVREYMEGIKWWMIMAQAHDGGFVIMPGRDYASTDHVYGTRNYPTACAALILSLKEKHLQITGAPRRTGAGDPARPASAVSARPARALSPEKRALLDPARLAALAEISHAGELKPLPVSISKASSKVWPTNLALGTNAVELVGKGTLGTTANATDYVNARRQLPLHHPVLLSGARRRARGRSQA
jgi:hypothetical protein